VGRDVTEAPNPPAVDPPRRARGGPIRTGRAAVGLTVVGLAVLGVTAALIVGLVGRGPGLTVAVGRNVQVTPDGDDAVIRAQNSPSIAVDPTDPRRILTAYRIDRPGFGCAVRRSTDGGRHWTSVAVPTPEGYDTCFAPDVAFAPDGTAYLLFTTLDTQSEFHPAANVPNGGWLARSTDHGAIFAAPHQVVPANSVQTRVTVGPSGRVYICWLQGDTAVPETPLGLGPPPNPLMMATSDDGGMTMSPPVQINPPDRLRVGAASVVVDGDGTVFVLYQDYRNDLSDYHNFAKPFDGTFTLLLARSTDDGRSFSQSVVDDEVVRARPFLIYLPPTPSLAVGPDGQRVYVAWQDARSGAPNVLLRRSDDRGRTWEAPQRLNERPHEPAAYLLPAVSVARDGRVDVIFLGQRPSGRRLLTDAWYVTSTDGGDDFSSPVRLTSRSYDGRIGPENPRNPGATDYGTSLALHSLPSGVLAAWPDSRRGTPATQRQDIVAARVMLR
jgi:hypothetical protein